MAGFEVTPMGDPTGGHFPLGVSPSPPRSVPAKVVPAKVLESPRLKRTRRGFLVVAKTGQVITPDKVKDFAEDDLA